jgi:hypothetical protein
MSEQPRGQRHQQTIEAVDLAITSSDFDLPDLPDVPDVSLVGEDALGSHVGEDLAA